MDTIYSILGIAATVVSGILVVLMLLTYRKQTPVGPFAPLLSILLSLVMLLVVVHLSEAGLNALCAGPVLGPHHPVMLKNVQWLKETSGMDGASHVQFEHVEPRQPDSRFECERRSVMGSAPGPAPSGANSPCSQTTLAGRASST